MRPPKTLLLQHSNSATEFCFATQLATIANYPRILNDSILQAGFVYSNLPSPGGFRWMLVSHSFRSLTFCSNHSGRASLHPSSGCEPISASSPGFEFIRPTDRSHKNGHSIVSRRDGVLFTVLRPRRQLVYPAWLFHNSGYFAASLAILRFDLRRIQFYARCKREPLCFDLAISGEGLL